MLRRRPPPLPTGRVRVPWSLAQRRSALLADADAGDLGREAAAAADGWLTAIFDQAIGALDGVALLAVGGLGRAELLPGSDLDLLLVHDGRADIAAAAERMWYPIWDDGQNLDHSVRTLGELQKAADADLRVALGLLDLRPVAGDAGLAAKAVERSRRLWEARLRRWLPEVVAAAGVRRDADEPVAFMLEPDLKDGHGGLRDGTTLRAVAQVAPVLRPTADHPAVVGAIDELRAVLVALARVTPDATRSRTRLLLQDQDAVAAAMGAGDADDLMRDIAAAGRAVAWASDDAWRRATSWLQGPSGRGAGADRPVAPGLVRRDDEIALAADADPDADPSLPLRAAAAAVEYGTVIARPTLDRLAAARTAPPPLWPPAMRDGLLRLLGSGHEAIPAIEALDQRDILVRLIPEWAPVRNRPQRNAFHRYTIDRHLLEAAAEAARLAGRVDRPDLLLAAALLHDIGKGRAGDHSQVGTDIAVGLATRMGFSPDDVAVIGRLVRHHLLLADTATRRDLDDPGTVTLVAEAVGDRSTLALLAALTEADSIATGATAWSPWKAGLVADLVARTDRLLAGHRDGTDPAEPAPQLDPGVRQLVDGRRLALRGDDRQLTVVAPDRQGLLRIVTGVLALRNVDVRAARTASLEAEGMAVLDFDVAPAFRELPSWESVGADIMAAEEGRLRLAERLADHERAYRRRVRARQASAPRVNVSFDDAASQRATVIDVRAADAPAVLSELAGALTDCDLVIDSARVVTLGAEVLDVFYVRRPDGSRVTDPGERRRIDEAVRAALTQ